MKVGYARVSTTGQKLDAQITALKEAGCEKIFTEKQSGKKENREQLQEAIDFCREGDTFVVTRLDRCSRSVKHLHQLIDTLKEKKVDFKATEQELDTSTSAGRLMIGLLSIVSAFETDLRAERQADGIKQAKKNGVKFGRKKKEIDTKQMEDILRRQKTETNQAIADSLGIARITLLKKVQEYKRTA